MILSPERRELTKPDSPVKKVEGQEGRSYMERRQEFSDFFEGQKQQRVMRQRTQKASIADRDIDAQTPRQDLTKISHAPVSKKKKFQTLFSAFILQYSAFAIIVAISLKKIVKQNYAVHKDPFMSFLFRGGGQSFSFLLFDEHLIA